MSDNADTIPGFPSESDENDDPFAKTTLLPADARVGSGGPSNRLQVGTVLRDRFMLQECIAGGGMGIVYKALDRRLAEVEGVDPWVAIKVLSPKLAGNAQALRALQQEAAKGRCLTHPNIVRFVDFDRENDIYFIVLEWLEGRSLAAILDSSEEQLDPKEALDIVRQIGEALSYAHRCGVVHADVKPGNIMVLPSGTVKLFDFGIARVRQHQEDGPRFDPGVLAAATPAYSSMQVLTGEEPVAADDVFSLACLAYRLIAGQRVFGSRNAAEAAESGIEPQRPNNLPNAQWKALRKALAHSRVARYASPSEFLDALLTTRSKTPEPSPAPELSTAPDKPLSIPDDAILERRREERARRWPYAVLVVLLGGIAITMLQPSWVSDVVSLGDRWLGGQTTNKRAIVAESTAPEPAPPAPGGAADTETESPTSGFETAQPAPTATGETVDGTPAAGLDSRVGTELPGAGESGTETGADGSLQTDDDAGDPTPGSEWADRVRQVPGTANEASSDSGAGEQDGAATPEDAATPAVAGQPEDTDPAATPDAAAAAAMAEAEGSDGLVLAAPGESRPQLDLTLREGGEPLVVDLYRWFGLNEALTVRVDEVGYSGNRSPRDTGQYTLSGNGIVSFDPGQRRMTLEIGMSADEDREPDQQVSLLLRDYYNAGSELASLNLSLLDDDQRAFESNHEVNTVAFAMNQISVRERDPAVQIDVLRLNPDQQTLTVRYQVDDAGATDGADYFSPGRRVLTFGPGQRTARLLIPLVQDSLAESDESFTIELNVPDNDDNTFRRIEVIIRDDD